MTELNNFDNIICALEIGAINNKRRNHEYLSFKSDSADKIPENNNNMLKMPGTIKCWYELCSKPAAMDLMPAPITNSHNNGRTIVETKRIFCFKVCCISRLIMTNIGII